MNEDSELLYQEFIKSFETLDDNLCPNDLTSSLFQDEDPNDPEYNFHQDITSLDLSEFLSFCEHLYENDNSQSLNQEQEKNETKTNDELVIKESKEIFTNDQLLILYHQMCFHIQTLAQNWIISIKHTNSLTNSFKELMIDLHRLSQEDNKNFLSFIPNLQPAYLLITKQEAEIISNEKNHTFEFALSTKSKRLFSTRRDIFIFDWALPQIQFKPGTFKTIFTPADNFLIAFGLYDYFRYNFKKSGFIKHIQQNFLPTHSYRCLANHLKYLKRALHDKNLDVNSAKYKELLSNPIVHYYREKKLPPFDRYFTVQNLPNIDKLEPPPQWYQKMNKEEHPLFIDEKKEINQKTENQVRKFPSLIKPNMEIHQLSTFVFNNTFSMYQLPVKLSLMNEYINSKLGVHSHIKEIKQYTKLLRDAKRSKQKKNKNSKPKNKDYPEQINEQNKSLQLDQSVNISNEDIYPVQCSSSCSKMDNLEESEPSKPMNEKEEVIDAGKENVEEENLIEFEELDSEENCIVIENDGFDGENEDEEIEIDMIDEENDLIEINKKSISEENEDDIENDNNNDNYNDNDNNDNYNDNDNNDNDNDNLIDEENDNDNNNDNDNLIDDENDLMALMEASWTTVSNRSKDADGTTISARRKADILALQRNSCKHILKNDFYKEEEKSRTNEMLINYYFKKCRKLLSDDDYVTFLELITSHLNLSGHQTQMTIDQAKSFYCNIKDFLIKTKMKYMANEESNDQHIIEGINELIQLLVLFLDIFQAEACGQIFQYMHWKRIFDFFRKVELYLSFIYSKPNQQHSCLQKLVRCLNQLMPENQENKSKIKSTVSKILNNHPLLIKEFSLLFLEEPLAPYLYSNDEDFDEFIIADSEQDNNANFEMENAFIPLNESDLKFGTNDCPCIHCHEQNISTSSNSQESSSNTNHCAFCSIRFISGRIYLPQINNKKLQLVEYVKEDKNNLKSVDSKNINNQKSTKQWTFHEDRLLLQACRSIILDSNIKKLTKQVIERIASILVPKFEKQRNMEEISERLFYLIDMMAHV